MMVSKMKLSTIATHLISSCYRTFRLLSTADKPLLKRRYYGRRDLFAKLSSIWSTGEKIPDVLDQFSRNYERDVKISHLLWCIKAFRNYGRYQHCLQILEWMEKNKSGFKDTALRLNLIYKTKGIDEAEKYFYSLPPDATTKHIYATLLNCYCSENLLDKALDLFEKMDEMNFASGDVTFANLMCLYLKLDQPEKVPPLVEEMKRRDIPLSSISYQTWIQSCGRLNNLEDVERVIAEVHTQETVKDKWKIYSSAASTFIKAFKYEEAQLLLKRVEDIIDKLDNPDRIAYHYLISLYAGAGDSGSVTRVWGKFKLKFKACNNLSYFAMLQALSRLGDIEHLISCFKEWNSRYKSYDVRLPTCVISAYLRHGMYDEAKSLLTDVTDRAGRNIHVIHIIFMDYHLEKYEINSALKHLEVALDNEWPWKSHVEKIYKFFEYFIEVKDVDSAEYLCRKLEKDQPLPLIIYLGLLQTYVAAGKVVPELRERMPQVIGTEHEELLNKVCPN